MCKEKDNKFLKGVFDRIDTDGSGLVTFEELIEGARRDPSFQSRLRVMDIDEADLKQLFEMIDVNEQGTALYMYVERGGHMACILSYS